MTIKPGWIQTYTGKIIYPADPDPELICLEDVAHALAMLCRYIGHPNQFYSVAQHSCLVSDHVSVENTCWGLFHDAAEAYLGDLSSPVKRMLPDFRVLEERLLIAIAEKFNLPGDLPDEVKDVDELIRATEVEALMKPTPAMQECFSYPERISGLEIVPWSWQSAEAQFLMRAHTLLNDHKQKKADVGSAMQRSKFNG